MNNKTILGSVAMVCITILIAMYLQVNRPNPASLTADRYTHCLSVAMSESRQSGKVIDIREAQEVCNRLQSR